MWERDLSNFSSICVACTCFFSRGDLSVWQNQPWRIENSSDSPNADENCIAATMMFQSVTDNHVSVAI